MLERRRLISRAVRLECALLQDLQLGLVTAQQHSPSASAVSARGSFPPRTESSQLQQLQDLQKHLQSQEFSGVISVPFEVPTPHSTSAAALFAAAAATQVSPSDTAAVTPSVLEKAEIPDIPLKATNRPTPAVPSSGGTKNLPPRSSASSPAFPAALHYANYATSIFGNNTTAQGLSHLVTNATRGEASSYSSVSPEKEVAAAATPARTGSGHQFSHLTSDKLFLLQLLQQQQEQQGKKQLQDSCPAQKPQQPALLTETLMRAASGSVKTSQAVTRAALARHQVERQLQQEERKQADQLFLQMQKKDVHLEVGLPRKFRVRPHRVKGQAQSACSCCAPGPFATFQRDRAEKKPVILRKSAGCMRTY